MSIDVQTDIRNTCLYDGGHFAVLMAMADCANTVTGEGIYPGLDLLAANSRLKLRRTQDIVQELREDLVVILQSIDGQDLGPEAQPSGGRGRKTEYRIDLERMQTLQGLHEAEVRGGRKKCHYCDARLKRAAARAQKGAISSAKGATNDVKGAIRGPHIDRTNEPSENRPLSAPAVAGDTNGVERLGAGEPGRFPEFFSAVKDTWPHGFVASDRGKAETEWKRLTRTVSPDVAIAAARAHGAAETARKATFKNPRKFYTSHPSTWLKDGGWKGYAQSAEVRQAESDHFAPALTRVRLAVGDGVFEIFRKYGLSEEVIALLDGIGLDRGPPAVFTTVRHAQKVVLNGKIASDIREELGGGFEVMLVDDRRSA